MELTCDFRDTDGNILFSSRAANLVLRAFPEIDQPELWQEPETLYGVETALLRASEPTRLKPRNIRLTFGFLRKDPRQWFDDASYVRRQIHGKRVRLTLCKRVGRFLTPLYTNEHEEDGETVEREMYYEGVASVGGVDADGGAAKLEIGLLADPWLYTQWRHETIEVNATKVNGQGEVVSTDAAEWNKPTLGHCSQVRFFSEHTEGTRDADSGVIAGGSIESRYRLRVWWSGGQRISYPLWIAADGKFYDSAISEGAARSFAVTSGTVDFYAASRAFTVLPMDLAANSALKFTGRGTVTMEYREGLAI